MAAVLYETRSTAALITLNRPDKRNALSRTLLGELTAAVARAADDASVRSVILTATGSMFCAGLDLAEVAADISGDPSITEEDMSNLTRLYQAVQSLPKPTIAAVNGTAVGGGAGLISVCDYVLLAEDAKIGYPEVKLGLTAAVLTIFLLRQVGERQTRRLLLGGEMIDAVEARRIGLVNEIVPADQLLPRAEALAAELATGGPDAIAATKKLLDELQDHRLEEDLERAMDSHRMIRLSEESREGIKAFFEKRKPDWVP